MLLPVIRAVITINKFAAINNRLISAGLLKIQLALLTIIDLKLLPLFMELATLHLPAAVGEYPEDLISRRKPRMRAKGNLQNE